jgi:hypothetical protein
MATPLEPMLDQTGADGIRFFIPRSPGAGLPPPAHSRNGSAAPFGST